MPIALVAAIHFWGCHHKGVGTGLIFKGVEFDTVKSRIVDLLPNPEKIDRETGSHPVLNHKPRIIRILRRAMSVREI
jgi:hypothetical protein